MKDHYINSIKNIIRHGDTDIFPFPFERYLFEDKQKESLAILAEIHKNLDKALAESPPLTIVKLSQVGYYGFRRATMIEPFWNAYFLGLVISIAEKVEDIRIPESEEKVFSYRYQWNEADGTLFKNSSWGDYKRKCVELSNDYSHVVQTDISNFYHRINHHKLENELNRISPTSDIPSRILKLLSAFTGTISYGLPVGGPASRILAELALNHTDLHLRSRGIVFCRYADDYTIFCNSESEGYKALILLSEKLANDQLSLQKVKTKVMTSDEFREIHHFLDPASLDSEMDDEQKLLNISIHYDPYSATAVTDYEALKDAVREIDIIGILSKEVHKSTIDQTVMKQAINAIKALDSTNQFHAVRILLEPDNLDTLSPVFTTILKAIRAIYNDLNAEGQDLVDKALLELFAKDNYLTKIEINLNFIVQVLSIRQTQEKEECFVQLYESETNHLLRRQIIVAMANWKCNYWIVDVKNNFPTMTVWERRAFIYASYFLGDEGKHWRTNNKNQFRKEELLIRDWSAERVSSKQFILV